ncbi:hypothetical protein A2524_03690 [Candidatus Wolfebacteria bacterium RIFOXYD12_FULL_48_21]|uniref:Uncharacterized protein n=1 Tax=Candidatus Wolfebacteria bacterium RIFOXYD1_FULL_48_65 TaxID=1802561 RepID=A0A1F8DYS9_9BACT|nr:MAG: hypothetical protein A2610_00230 [Candidatus Wolfebacteria bacterium RIFOXYD1_FULL_48_65]OGM95155.1 MAG: hypothetical protein A2524_03690 [Candidatus Wolfebacteria bacterium RIFOXYD12_FULL_48_21]OGM95753.1 MAG: hypothetical protein A2532_03505 [Candidatus Wolfebacteria bacterium RIFOXYD2_FULL_48_11]
MAQESVATPTQNYLENEDLVFEIGDEEIETKKKRGDDDHVGYGQEAEPADDDIVSGDEEDVELEEFSGFDWADEEDIVE